VVGELAAGIAHEVNNPVNFAMNAVKTLRSESNGVREVAQAIADLGEGEGEGGGKALRALAKLRDEVHFDDAVESISELSEIAIEGLTRTSELVGDLRNFAAPDGRRGEEVDLVRGLRSTLRLVGHGFSREGIEVALELPADLPRVIGETRALNQVFLNLLKNAAEAFEGRGGHISIEAHMEGHEVVIQVQDDGTGIPPGAHAQIFEPFFTTKGDGGGTGLGLSICRSIVEDLGGLIELEGRATGGTTARMRLPEAGHGEASRAS
jgi:two-component system NtrC family sensor kinase